jgi:predicted amidohydrolase
MDPTCARVHSYVHQRPPAAGEGLRLALWQGSGNAASSAAVAENLERLEQVCSLAAAHGVQLLAFPELYLSGYIVTPELASALAEPVDGPSLQRVAAAARRHGLAIACPYP